MLISAILAVVLAAGGVSADARQVQFEENVLAELARVAPAALEDGRRGSEAYVAGRWQEAFDAYGRVVAAAPHFDHALRRQCRARLHLEDRSSAVPICRAALAAAATPANHLALAAALSTRSGSSPNIAEKAEAGRLARSALDADRDDVSTAQGACEVALRIQEVDLLETCSSRLLVLDPGTLPTEYFAMFTALVRERFGDARRHLAAARAAGLQPDDAKRLARLIEDREPLSSRWGPVLLWTVGAWVALLGLLLVAGAVLSAVTLRGARRMATDRQRREGPATAVLRWLYAAVLGLTCFVYYLSLPVVALLVAAAGYGAWLGFAAVGRVPVKLVLIVAVTVLVSLWAVLKSLWACVMRRQDADPGLRLGGEGHPRFGAALAQAASRVGTRPVDTVFLTPGTDAAVFERGGLARQLAGRSERCLILGVGLLDGMTQGQLKAVLAHEYGHFVNRDTAGGGLALAVRRSIFEMARSLASGGAAAWYNPAWLFVTNFHRLFLRVSQGASRLQEILADRWAALAYGGGSFAAGLTHVVTRSIRFDQHADATLREVVDGGRALRNLYRYAPAKPVDEQGVSEQVRNAMNAEPSPYDSHPRPADRIAWVGDVPAAYPAAPDEVAPAWELFTDREALEQLLTAEVRASVASRHGVEIPVEESPATERVETATA
jgi:Zn-dependent protease with chaperone function